MNKKKRINLKKLHKWKEEQELSVYLLKQKAKKDAKR